MARASESEPASAAELRARSVRGVVFLSRLFEYECRALGISMAQYRMLLYLRHGPRRAGELAEQASITRPALSTLITAMEADKPVIINGWLNRFLSILPRILPEQLVYGIIDWRAGRAAKKAT